MTERRSALADEAKWWRLDRICVDLKRSRRLACAVSSAGDDNDGRRRRRRGNFISRRDARRPSQRNYLLRLAVRRRLARVLHGQARPLANPSRPVRCAPGRTALSDGRSAGQSVGRAAGNAFPTHSATDRQISTTSAMLPAHNTSSDVCAADRYSSVFESRRSSRI